MMFNFDKPVEQMTKAEKEAFIDMVELCNDWGDTLDYKDYKKYAILIRERKQKQ